MEKLKRQYKLLKIKFEQNSLRERVILFVMVLLVTFMIWYWLFYTEQANWLEKVSTKQQAELEQIELFKSQRQEVLDKAQNRNIIDQINRHGGLSDELTILQKTMGKFKHEFVPPEELALMMYSMLKGIEGVRLISFKSLIEANNQTIGEQTEKEERQSANDSVVVNRYRLVLKGEYLSILYYLKQLESIEWRLYWDKFNYKVLHYPRAEVSIDFYTLTSKERL
jgi:MSHA biogenesis protein MshJ